LIFKKKYVLPYKGKNLADFEKGFIINSLEKERKLVLLLVSNNPEKKRQKLYTDLFLCL